MCERRTKSIWAYGTEMTLSLVWFINYGFFSIVTIIILVVLLALLLPTNM